MRGFSLIELLVVIAIVGILAAIATPAYKSYSVRAKFSSLMPIIIQDTGKIKSYYSTHNAYPTTLTQIGYSASAVSTEINPYLLQYSFGGAINGGCTPDMVSQLGAYWGGANLGLSDVGFIHVVYNSGEAANGVYQTFCYYGMTHSDFSTFYTSDPFGLFSSDQCIYTTHPHDTDHPELVSALCS